MSLKTIKVISTERKKKISKYTGESEDSADDNSDEESPIPSREQSDDDSSGSDDGDAKVRTKLDSDLEFSSSDEEKLPEGFKRKKRVHRKRIRLSDSDEAEEEAILAKKSQRYLRGDITSSYRNVKNPKLRAKLKSSERAKRESARSAALSEVLLPETSGYLEAEGEMERTDRISQHTIADLVDVQTARKVFDLKLTQMGPYVSCAYSRNGRSLLLAGAKGHVAMLDWSKGQIQTEIQVKETVRDCVFLHDETLFAVAQRKYVYIYDRDGVELHCLRKHINANRLAFLPYHFLLVSAGDSGFLKYQDVSTGAVVAELPSRLGPCRAMCQNPWNAVIHTGHADGTATLWAPNIHKPLVKLLCHTSPLLDVAVDAKGLQMATSAIDGKLKLWDLRNGYAPLHTYSSHRPVSSIAISQRGLLATGAGPHVRVWPEGALATKAANPYMRAMIGGQSVGRVAFCPFEDVLGVAHSEGFSSMLIPGSGEANYDTFEVNPFQTGRQRREHQVHQLLDKIQPDLISIQTNLVGQVDPRTLEEKKAERDAREAEDAAALEEKRRGRGKNPGLRAKRRKNANIRDARSVAMDEKMAAERKLREAAAQKPSIPDSSIPSALQRFVKKR